MSDFSDSDDDCYSNTALRLQKLKNKFKGEIKLVNEPNKEESTSKLSATKNEVPAPQESIENLLVNDGVLDAILAKNATKRATRAKARQKKQEAAASDTTDQPSSSNKAKSKTKSAVRGRKRGRIATPSPRGRSRRRPCCFDSISPFCGFNSVFSHPDIPTYSVGNTYEYPDMSDNQALFSTKPTETSTIDLNDSIEENEELSVKVYWQSTEFFKFGIRKFQKITQIFDYFAKKENVSPNNLLFTYNERILNRDDTPESINYSIAKFIDGGIVHENVSSVTVRNDASGKDGIKLKFQCLLVKKPFEINISLDEKLSIGMMKYAEHIEKPINKLKFQFDGDCLSGKSTPRDLDLEGGECIDVVILS